MKFRETFVENIKKGASKNCFDEEKLSETECRQE